MSSCVNVLAAASATPSLLSVPFTGAVPIVNTICAAVLSTSSTLNIKLVMVLLVEPSLTVIPVLTATVGESLIAFTVIVTVATLLSRLPSFAL